MPALHSTVSRSSSSRPPPRRLVEHALTLIGQEQHGEPAQIEAARAELIRWRQADPAHESAFETAQHYWSATEASALKDNVPLPRNHAEREAQAQQKRRRVLTLLGLGGMVAALGVGGRWAWLQPVEQIALHTGRGQLLGRDLPDGSHIDLAANTQGHLNYYRNRREVRLTAGEMRFDVRTDTDRPFIVNTAWGRVEVLGTIFSVTVRDERMRVEVAQGRVAVWTRHDGGVEIRTAGAPGLVLEAGEGVNTDSRGMGARTQVRAESVGAWRDGWLVFSSTPLAEAVDRWNDYLVQPLRLADNAALRDMRLTGSFPIRDPGAFLQNLPQMLPVRVARESGAIVLEVRR